ncbi:MAG: T9SS type A sorting domain-containing protein [Bacteroidales bacterium]
MEDIYLRDFPGVPPEFQGIWDCTQYSRNRFVDFSGFANFENYPYFAPHENTTNNARFNIPMLQVRIIGPPHHDINCLYVGNGTEGDVTENLIDGYLYIENGGTIKDPRNYYYMHDSSRQDIRWEGYFNWIRAAPWGEGDDFGLIYLVSWELDENLEAVLSDYQSDNFFRNIIPFDPTKYDTITFEGVPENKLINYQSDLDISGSLEEKVDSVYSKLEPIQSPEWWGDGHLIIQYVFTKTDYENSEKIPLNEEYPNHHYKYIRKAIAETPWIKDSVSWEIEVKDIEAPKINDFPEDEQREYQTSLDLENYVVPENLEVTDNSGLEAILEKSTESTQTMDGTVNQVNFDFYTDITVADKFGNDTTYTHKAEVRDTEAPEGNLSAYYVQRDSGQSPEEAVKSLVENVYDNSELPVDTLVEQTSEKFYDVFLKDVAGNENYLGNVEADWPVGTGDEINNSGIRVYPNPVKNILYISSSTPIAKVVVTGTDGVRKLELLIHNASVDISALEPGIYILELYNQQNDKLHSRQIVVQ